MSRPANPLSRFRTYSYYHVLVLCDSSETAEALSKKSNQKPERWRHASGPNAALGQDDTYGVLGPFAVKYVDEKQKTGRYCVLINGATDAAFTIATARWYTVTGAAVTMADSGTSIAVEGSLEISEPKGVVFLDVLVNCSLALGVDAANVVYVLKTFFVGHPDDRTDDSAEFTNDSYVSDVEPLRFICYDVTASFAETGGLYHMEFVGLNHGASRLPQYGKAASGFNLTAGNTLKTTFDKLAALVNENYELLYQCVYDTIKQAEEGGVIDSTIKDDKNRVFVTTSGTQKKFSELLDRVSYEITLDKNYWEDRYKVQDQPVQSKTKAPTCTGTDKTKNTEAQVHIEPNMSIEDAIHQIMKRCGEVVREMGQTGSTSSTDGSSGPDIRYEYKIHTGVQSWRDAGDGNKIKYRVRYCIERFMRPKDVNVVDNFKLASETASTDLTKLPPDQVAKLTAPQRQLYDNLIGFDYIYTGKNVDILEFDMKMNMGLAYLQTATIANTLKDQLQAVASSTTHVPQYDATNIGRFGRPTQIPVFFGTQIRLPTTRNKQDMSANVDAAYTLSKHASLEVVDSTMKIHGNPYMLNTVNRATSPEQLCLPRPEQNTDPVTRKADFRDWSHYPSFAKVNIRMPRNNDDISLFKATPTNAQLAPNDADRIGAADFTREFWFTGFFYVVGIEHVFDDGTFTQTLTMLGIPQSSAVKAANKQGQTSGQDKIQKIAQSCYSGYVDVCDPNFIKRQDAAAAAAAKHSIAKRSPGEQPEASAPPQNSSPPSRALALPHTPPPPAGAGAKDLIVKGGANGQAFAGGSTHPGTLALATQIQNNVKDFQIFTSFNDRFHAVKFPTSNHAKGLALDYTVSSCVNGRACSSAVGTTRSILARAGLSPSEYYILDEYLHPSKGSTGGHIHVEFLSAAAADKFLKGDKQAAPAPTSAPPTNTADTTKVTNSLDVNCIKGWNKASPEVKKAITDASAKRGVDPGLMAAMAAQESSLSATAGAGGKGATGLYQFTQSTWRTNQYGGVAKVYGSEIGAFQGKTNQEIDDLRYNPTVSADAAALTLRDNKRELQRAIPGLQPSNCDIYLAHFMGPHQAGLIIKADQANHNTHPRDVLPSTGNYSYSEVVRKNSWLASAQTVGEWRATVCSKLLQQNTCGTMIVQSQNTQSRDAVRDPRTGKVKGITSGERVARNTKCPGKNQDKTTCNQTATGEAATSANTASNANAA